MHGGISASVVGVASLVLVAALVPTASWVAAADSDLDGLSDDEEYLHGTNPYDSDSDDGGENDGSEVDLYGDPLDPSDDEIQALGWVRAWPADGAVVLSFDVRSEYELLRVYRKVIGWPLYVLLDGNVPPIGVYVDDGLTNGGSQAYCLMAVDAYGHRSAVTPPVAATPSANALFSDTFETGDASRWASSSLLLPRW